MRQIDGEEEKCSATYEIYKTKNNTFQLFII